MVQAGARQAGERALPAGRLLAGGRPSQHLWRGLQSLAGPWGCAGGSVQGAPGPRSAPPWGPGHLGFLLGQRCCRESECGQCWAQCPLVLHAGCSRLPPAGPPSLTLWAETAGLPTAPSPPGPPFCPPVLGVALACYTDPLSFAFSCFPWCPVTLWETGRQDWPGPEPGGAGLGSGRVQQMLALELRGGQVGGVWVHSASSQA